MCAEKGYINYNTFYPIFVLVSDQFSVLRTISLFHCCVTELTAQHYMTTLQEKRYRQTHTAKTQQKPGYFIR